MNESQQQRLSANIHTLGNILGQTIIEQEGQAVFDLEQVRTLWKDMGALATRRPAPRSRRRCPR